MAAACAPGSPRANVATVNAAALFFGNRCPYFSVYAEKIQVVLFIINIRYGG